MLKNKFFPERDIYMIFGIKDGRVVYSGVVVF
jgi:hypothetical protein